MTAATVSKPCRACDAVPTRPVAGPREVWRNAMAIDLLERLLGDYAAAALQLLDAAAIAAAGNNNELALQRLRSLDELVARALLKRIGQPSAGGGQERATAIGEETPT